MLAPDLEVVAQALMLLRGFTSAYMLARKMVTWYKFATTMLEAELQPSFTMSSVALCVSHMAEARCAAFHTTSRSKSACARVV